MRAQVPMCVCVGGGASAIAGLVAAACWRLGLHCACGPGNDLEALSQLPGTLWAIHQQTSSSLCSRCRPQGAEDPTNLCTLDLPGSGDFCAPDLNLCSHPILMDLASWECRLHAHMLLWEKTVCVSMCECCKDVCVCVGKQML